MTSSAPIWVTIVVAIIGMIGIGGAAFLTQWRSDKRETASWNRQSQRLQSEWAREDDRDALVRRDVSYASLISALRSHSNVCTFHAHGQLPIAPVLASLESIADKLAKVDVDGTDNARSLAENSYQISINLATVSVQSRNVGIPAVNGPEDFATLQTRFQTATEEFIATARLETVRKPSKLDAGTQIPLS